MSTRTGNSGIACQFSLLSHPCIQAVASSASSASLTYLISSPPRPPSGPRHQGSYDSLFTCLPVSTLPPPVYSPHYNQGDVSDRKSGLLLSFFLSFFFFFFYCRTQWHMEVPRLGAELEQQLPAYATATATPDLSHVYNPHHSSQQHQILDPLSEARDQTQNLMDPSRVR